jgi:hypothetical protein
VNTEAPGRHEERWYEIRLQGRLDERWTAWFDGMTVTTGPDTDPDSDTRGQGGLTVLRGPVVDQSALHGLLARLRDVGLPLISVARVESGPMAEQDDDEGEGR